MAAIAGYLRPAPDESPVRTPILTGVQPSAGQPASTRHVERNGAKPGIQTGCTRLRVASAQWRGVSRGVLFALIDRPVRAREDDDEVPPATGTALVLLVAFVLPGFVTVLLQERTFKSADDPTPYDRLLRAVYYSVWCYLVLAGLALILGLDRHWAQSFFDRHQNNPAGLVWLRTAAHPAQP